MKTEPVLKNTFAEAIFEFRWGNQNPIPNVNVNILPSLDYKLFLAKLFDNLKKDYPIVKTLTNANVPEEFAHGLVQYQFRKNESEFPLVQAGVGVFTVNENKFSSLDTFKETAIKEMGNLYKSYPNPSSLDKFKLVLNYVFGKEFDFKTQNMNAYINSQTKLNITLDADLLAKTGLNKNIETIETKLTLDSTTPLGKLVILIGKGKKEGKEALVWNISFISEFEKQVNPKETIEKWIPQAEKIINRISQGLIK